LVVQLVRIGGVIIEVNTDMAVQLPPLIKEVLLETREASM